DFTFVLVLHWGIAGTAVATILSQFLSAGLILLLLTRSREIYRLRWAELSIDWTVMRQIVAVGLPQAIQSVLTAFSNIFVQGYINFFGSDCMAGWAVYNKLDQFIMLPMNSMAMAATTFVSQNVGAGDDSRADRGTVNSLFITFGVTGLVVLPICLWAEGAVRFFSPDAGVVEFGVLFIRANTVFLLFNCINHVLAGALRGRGDSRGPMLIMLATFVGVRQVYLFVLTRFLSNTPRWVGFGYPVGWMCCCAVELSYYFARRRARLKER
ncbi:MAG: MATE family efflux transporter, partial [bacterium]